MGPATARYGASGATAIDVHARAVATERWCADDLRRGERVVTWPPRGPRVRYAAEWDTSGIAIAAHRCMQAMITAGASLSFEPLREVDGGARMPAQRSDGAPDWLRALRAPRDANETLILHCGPQSWAAMVEMIPARHRIGHTVWELERLPSRWRDEIRSSRIDELWVPTVWNQATYEAVLDLPVRVIPHALSAVVPAPPPIDIPADHRVITILSAWVWRKRPDRSLEAALRACEGRRDVTVVVKTGRYTGHWPGHPVNIPDLIAELIRRARSDVNVIVDQRQWSDAQIEGLIQRSTCMVSLTGSEGWALGPFDAAARSVPVVITGYGGHLEWIGADHPGLVPFRWVRSNHPDPQLFELDTQLAYADMDAAVERIRAVLDDDAVFSTHCPALADQLRERYAPARVGERCIAALADAGDERSTVDSGVVGSTTARRDDRHHDDTVIVLTPVKNAAHHAPRYVDLLLSLTHRPDAVAVLVSDSDDGSADAFRHEFTRLTTAGITATVHEHDYGYRIPTGLPRYAPSIQLERRAVLAKSRNRLLMSALGDQRWVLWIDVDVIDYPPDILTQLLDDGGEIVHPHCVTTPGGASFDKNAWTDRGQWHLDAYRGLERVELHAVGGTMLLVLADHHREGLVWPAAPYGAVSPRARTDSARLGRVELGEIESEGLGILAHDLGIACWGRPDLEIRHAPD